jgi:hypothetical protein
MVNFSQLLTKFYKIMKKLILLCSVFGLAASANAGLQTIDSTPAYKPANAQCFYAGETSFDLISLYVNPTGSTDNYDVNLESGAGAGIGLTHFITDSFGLSGRAYWWDTESIVNSVTASAILRKPIESLCLAPFVYGGVGGHFDSVNQFSTHLGAGVEYRLTDRIGVIGDFSRTFTEETQDWDMYTLGLRIKF